MAGILLRTTVLRAVRLFEKRESNTRARPDTAYSLPTEVQAVQLTRVEERPPSDSSSHPAHILLAAISAYESFRKHHSHDHIVRDARNPQFFTTFDKVTIEV